VENAFKSAVGSITGIFSFAVLPTPLLGVGMAPSSDKVTLMWPTALPADAINLGVSTVIRGFAMTGFVATSAPTPPASTMTLDFAVRPLVADPAAAIEKALHNTELALQTLVDENRAVFGTQVPTLQVASAVN
jgi:hypothetical protein